VRTNPRPARSESARRLRNFVDFLILRDAASEVGVKEEAVERYSGSLSLPWY